MAYSFFLLFYSFFKDFILIFKLFFYDCLYPLSFFLTPILIVKHTVSCLEVIPPEPVLLCICNLFCLHEQNLKRNLAHGVLVASSTPSVP